MSMKKPYEKPTLCVEDYKLTQAVSVCSGIKIFSENIPGNQDVKNDPDATNAMLDWVRIGGFLDGGLDCLVPLDGFVEDSGVCYHTNMNAAFTS